MPSTYDPANDLDGIIASFHAHLVRRRERGFDGRKTPGNGFPFPPDAPTLWVKFHPGTTAITRESAMQSYVYEHFPLLDGCQVPKVRRVHTLPDKTNGEFFGARPEDLPWGFIVMDYIKGTRLVDMSMEDQEASFQDILASRVAAILVSLSSLRAPEGTLPGNGDGEAMSSLVWEYDDFDSPQRFNTVSELEEYINEQVEETPVPATADFSKEPLCLCYGDFNEANFILEDPSDPHSTLSVIDFERTNWLPVSFLLWEVNNRGCYDGAFYRRIGDAVKKLLPEPPNMDNIQAIHSLRWKRGRQGH